jgi:hypothetical protein
VAFKNTELKRVEIAGDYEPKGGMGRVTAADAKAGPRLKRAMAAPRRSTSKGLVKLLSPRI